MLKSELNEGSTFREAKEKLHMAAIALNKAIDISVIEHQILSLKNHISCDVFIADVAKIKEERSSESAQLLEELGLGGTRIVTPSIRRASAVQLYSSVIEKIAHNKKVEDDKQVKSEESIAKKVERLRDTAPHELLDAKIRISISEALASKKCKGKGKSGKLDKFIDYGAAYSMRVSDNDHLLEETVRAPPGLSSRLGFHKPGPKVKHKAEGKGKGKVVKGKGKHKLKGKDGKSSGKTKGSKGRTKSIDKKGAGKGASSGKNKLKSKGKKGASKAPRR